MNNKENAMEITYTTTGSVRGSCSHSHKSLETAVRCLMDDRSGCMSQGGYSDRHIVRADGEPLSNEEFSRAVDVWDNAWHVLGELVDHR